MVKAPLAGRVKTRLASEAGASQATRFARHAVAALLDRVGRDPRWRTILAVTPDRETPGHFWPRRFPRRPQGGGDLGERMQRIMDQLSPGPVVIIGSDIPAIRASHVAQAFRALGGHGAVCGPSPDGGYWLVGLKRSPRVLRVFDGVRWSSAHARADTLANLKRSRVALISELEDVDEATNLVLWNAAAGRRIARGQDKMREEANMDQMEPEASGPPLRAPTPSTGTNPTEAEDLASAPSTQYSPAHVLQSGRRAEAAGRPDYAIQFYRHLLEHHPDSPEGRDARESLDRLTAPERKPARELERATLFPELPAPSPARELRPLKSGEALARLAYREEESLPEEAAGEPAPAQGPRKRYGLGKSLARLLAGFGLFLALAGVIVPIAALLGQPLGPFSIDVSGLPLAVLLAPIALGLGIGMLVASQAAFAVFDQVEDLRQLRGMDAPRRDSEL